MTLTPYLDAPLYIQIHAATASLALVLGPVALFRKRQDRLHKQVGYIWFLAMAAAAGSSFFIHSFALIGPFSPLHGLAILTLWSLWSALRYVRAGRVQLHRLVLRNLYFYGLVIAGLANFLPGRTTNRMFFPDAPELGWAVIGLGAAVLLGHMARGRRQVVKAA